MLEIRNLEKSFGKKQVLFGIDLTAKKGSILGLIGKNGAGKTTIFHSILRFLDYSGDIQLGWPKQSVKKPIRKLATCQKSEALCLS